MSWATASGGTHRGAPCRARVRALTVLGFTLAALTAPAARAFEFLDGRIQVHGYVEEQLRMMSDGFRTDRWFFSQWANVLALEVDIDIAKNGFGPFDSVSGFVRGEVRFDCIWSQACGLSRTTKLFGNRANRAPGNLANGVTSGLSGTQRVEPEMRIQNSNNNLIEFFRAPPLDGLADLGANNLDTTFAPVKDGFVTTKRLDGSIGPIAFQLGPWLPKQRINPIGALAGVPNRTGPFPPQTTLPLRPVVPNANLGYRQAHGLYVPSQALLREMDGYDGFDQNFSQEQLQWNHGASQGQTGEMKEAYVELEMLDGSLFWRLGKQQIVWGKTELFRTTDQFNPQDIGLSSLPSLEESRIALWAARAIYSLYDVGPLEDFRIELAANLDGYQPIDFGKCGEPYAVWLVCGKSFGLFGHGLIGVGIAGEQRPQNWWEDVSGLEFGARVEFRWDRFSFAITDFWGYSDFPTVDYFNQYQRNVDPNTGVPLDVNGNPLTAANALRLHPANRQAFDVICSATVGIAGAVIPSVAENCLLDLLNSPAEIPNSPLPGITISRALGGVLAGQVNNGAIVGAGLGNVVLKALTATTPLTPAQIPGPPIFPLVYMNRDPGDNPANPSALQGFFPGSALSQVTSPQQQALLGCGPFYGTNCDNQGIDLFNAEASVLIQSFPQFEPGGPVATRFVNGRLITLPGARGPGDVGYDPFVDGCTGQTDLQGNLIPACQTSNQPLPGPPVPVGARLLVNPLTGQRFQNELGAASWNFLVLLYSLGTIRPASGCSSAPIQQNRTPTLDEVLACDFVGAVFGVTGTQRPEAIAGGTGRFGRRDFLWSSGSELQLFYQKRNVLGFSTDFAEDKTKTNWSMEFTWFANDTYANTMQPRGYSNMDSLNMTVSVDRPTFINFANTSRTFFFNSQWFLRYLPEWEGNGTFNTDGPWSLLGTFSVFTGYFQDRLLPSITTVFDVQSQSGAVIGQVTYRFSEVFSATVGVANFYGTPSENRIPIRQAVLGNNGGDFMTRTGFNGLTPIAERDEVYVQLRYTF